MRRLIDWMHPSYRDLVIDELHQNATLRKKFLAHAGLGGLSLALSAAGGAQGSRRFPLMESKVEWAIVTRRGRELATDPTMVSQLITIAANAVSDANPSERKDVLNLLQELCEIGGRTWNEAKFAIRPSDLEVYYNASILISPLPPMPDLSSIWDQTVSMLENRLEDDSPMILDSRPLLDFKSVIRTISNAEPRFLKQRDFPTSLRTLCERLLKRVNQEAGTPFGDDADELEYEAACARSLRWTLEEVLDQMGSDQEAIDTVRANLENHETECEKQSEIRAPDAPRGDDEEEDDERSRVDEAFDVDALFSDL
jgi:hypothetical protein